MINQKIMDDYIDSLMDSTKEFIPSWNMESFKGKWNYIDGVFLKSMLACYDNYKDNNPELAAKYKSFVISYVNYFINEEGTFVYNKYNPDTNSYEVIADNKQGYKSGELDTVCESQNLFKLYELTNDTRYLKAIEYTYGELMKHGRLNGSKDLTVNFEHKAEYPSQIWLDGMFMYVPFYSQYAKLKNDASIFNNIYCHYKTIMEKMYDQEKHLFYHGYDATNGQKVFWAKADGNSKSFWLRSTGWLIVSLVDSIGNFPEGEEKNYLINMLNTAIKGILEYIDKDSKMFYQIIDLAGYKEIVKSFYLDGLKNKNYVKNDGTYEDTEIANYLESSGSSMIAYTLLKGVRLGYLDQKYKEIGKEILEGVYNHSLVIEDGTPKLFDICITGGLGPASRLVRDGSASYYLAETVGSNDAKGVGPFIMAYTEYKNM